MDFRSLSRRELQALCKRNKIPANITNVAMADALSALPSVEGIEEFLNGEGSGIPESPMKQEFVNSEITRTALRTSTRRKTVKDEPITTRTRREAAAKSEESENRDLNVAMTTPSLASRRRTVTASSACKKVDFQMTVDAVEKEDDDLDQEKNEIEKTPSIAESHKRVAAASTRRRTETRNNGATERRVYSTRRSARLLEKSMESLSLGGDEKMEPITVHMSFDEMPNSTGHVKEDTSIEIESKKTDESKLDDDLELEIDNQVKNKLESEVKVSELEPEINLDPLNGLAENLVVTAKNDDPETEAADNNLNVKCLPEVEEANVASKDDDSGEVFGKYINDSDKFPQPTEDVDLTEVHNSSIVEESSKEVDQNESICESECLSEDVDLTEVHNSSVVEESSKVVEQNKSSCESECVSEDVDLTEVHNSSIVEESSKVVEQNESSCESECISEENAEEEAELTNISAALSLPHEIVEEEIQVDELIKYSTEVHNSSIVEESSKVVEQNESSCCESECISEENAEEEAELTNISAALSLPHEIVEEEIQVDELIKYCTDLSLPHEEEETLVDDVLSVKESVMEVKDGDLELEEHESLDANIEGDKKKMEMETVSVQADEEDTVNSMDFPENVSEELVDVKIQWQMEEAPENINVDAIDSQPEVPNDVRCEEEALVEVSVTSTKEFIPTSSNIKINGVQSLPSFEADQLALANQFPRPTVESKSPLKDQTIKLLIDNSDAEEDEDEKEQDKENFIQRQNVEKTDMSLRQLRKMFKEQLQLSKKKMDNNNNTKVVGGGKLRTALQPVQENRMALNELEKRF